MVRAVESQGWLEGQRDRQAVQNPSPLGSKSRALGKFSPLSGAPFPLLSNERKKPDNL